MSEQLAFLEAKYGKLFNLDLHGLTKEEARAEIIHTIGSIDCFYNGILITHGYHAGRVLKDLVRSEFKHPFVYKKINIDASRTLLLMDWGR